MKKNLFLAFLIFAFGIGFGTVASRAGSPPVSIENLLRADSQLANDIEVIVSRVEIGPNFSLPKHYHPGEEYVYMLEGTSTVWQQGKPDTKLVAGDIFKIPFEQVHTAMTSDDSAKALIFRVHKKGQPDRIPAN